MKKRNSLIELYRFFFALNVVKSHGFFPEGFHYFSPGRVSVEFFFVLSGYLFWRTLEKLRDLPLRESLVRLLVGKLRPLLFPLVLGLLSNLIYNIVDGDYFSGVWGYLWYVHAMLIMMIVYVVLRRLIKSDKAFFYTVLGICVAATLMRFSGVFYSWGYVRAAATLSLGMLLTKIPNISDRLHWISYVAVPCLAATCLAIVCFHLGNIEWWGGFMGVELILDTVLYPMLIYFTFQLDVSCPLLDYLGALSFGLYAFQCPADLLRVLGVENRYILLAFIVLATITEDAAKRIRKHQKDKRALSEVAYGTSQKKQTSNELE